MFLSAKTNMENKLNNVTLSPHNMWFTNVGSCNLVRWRAIQGFQVSRYKIMDQNAGTRSWYFDMNALKQKIDSYGSGLWRGWRHFQQIAIKAWMYCWMYVSWKVSQRLAYRTAKVDTMCFQSETDWRPVQETKYQSDNLHWSWNVDISATVRKRCFTRFQ